MMVPPPVLLFDLLKFLPLFVSKIDRDLPVRLRHGLMDTPAGVASYLPELHSRVINNWRNFADLLWRQAELRAKALLHPVANSSRTVALKEKMPVVPSSECSTGDSTSHEYKNESGNKFPPQRAVHCENSS